MSTATRTTIEDQIKANLELVKDFKAAVAPLSAKSDTAIEQLKGDKVVDRVSASLVAQRLALGAYINPEGLREATQVLFLELGDIADLGPSEVYDADFADRLKADLHAQGRTIKQRGLTYGAVTPGVVQGDGVIEMLTVDRWGYPLEATHLETKTIRCVEDQNTGAQAGREELEWLGEAASRYFDTYQGSGVRETGFGRNAADSLLPNSSFDSQFASGGGASKIPGWNISAGDANIARSTDIYRVSPAAQPSTSGALEFSGDATMEHLVRNRNTTFATGVPYQLDLAVKPGTGTGTINILIGNGGRSESLAALPGPAPINGWHRLRLVMDEKLYYPYFGADGMKVTISITGHGGGNVLVDDVSLQPMVPVDGLWYWPIGGASNWLFEDEYTAAVSLTATDSVLAYWFWWMGLGSFPSDPVGMWQDP